MLLKGRRKITTQFTPEEVRDNAEVLYAMLNQAMGIHYQNKVEIDYLLDYSKGNQEILNKVKTVRPEINNKLVINHAQMITRNIIGYFLGTPIQYIQAGDGSKKSEIDYLNRVVSYEDKASVDREIGEYQSITGTAYRIIFTDGQFADEIPFEDKSLNPSNTFVVYTNDIAERPVCGVHYYNTLDGDGMVVGVTLQVYSNYGLYIIKTDNPNAIVNANADITFQPYSVGGVPIIEYPNNMWRIGDWEFTLGLMDAINALHSGRLDDIDQVVQSLIVFINAEVDAETYDEMRESGLVMLKNTTNFQTSIETIENTLDQVGMSGFAMELENLLYAMLGIPDRNNRAGGGGDTGQAVELRDGWADLEIVARNKELTFKKAEKQALRIILNILGNSTGNRLSLLDVDIKFSRNKNNNLLVKTQSFQTLLMTKTLDPADCLSIVDLVSDVNEYIERGKAFWGEEFGGKTPVQENVQTEPDSGIIDGEGVIE